MTPPQSMTDDETKQIADEHARNGNQLPEAILAQLTSAQLELAADIYGARWRELVFHAAQLHGMAHERRQLLLASSLGKTLRL